MTGVQTCALPISRSQQGPTEPEGAEGVREGFVRKDKKAWRYVWPDFFPVHACIIRGLNGAGDIILYDGHLAVYKHSLDLIFYMLGGPLENELMLYSALTAFMDAVHLLLRNQVEKRAVLENLDCVILCLDETIDDGYVLPLVITTFLSLFFFPFACCADDGDLCPLTGSLSKRTQRRSRRE